MAKRGKRAAGPSIEHKRLDYSFRFRMRVADGILGSLRLASVAVPLYFVWKIFESVAGKTTVLSISLITKISIGVSVASIAGVIVAWKKMKEQKKELIRCRERIIELEEQLPHNRYTEEQS